MVSVGDDTLAAELENRLAGWESEVLSGPEGIRAAVGNRRGRHGRGRHSRHSRSASDHRGDTERQERGACKQGDPCHSRAISSWQRLNGAA
jgi:hypothetical protein